jgi:hypothetical protein
MKKMQVVDMDIVTGIFGAKNGLQRVGGGGSGFFGEERTKLGRGNG